MQVRHPMIFEQRPIGTSVWSVLLLQMENLPKSTDMELHVSFTLVGVSLDPVRPRLFEGTEYEPTAGLEYITNSRDYLLGIQIAHSLTANNERSGPGGQDGIEILSSTYIGYNPRVS